VRRSPQVAVRVGVVLCVGAACLFGAGRLDDALAVFDFQADTNAAASFNDRTFPAIAELPGGQRVMEDARLWMPEDAVYVVAHRARSPKDLQASSLRYFLRILLSPRRQTRTEPAPWLFCYRCTARKLAGYQVLSNSGHGFVFARRRS
jgi:hypothetical protein